MSRARKALKRILEVLGELRPMDPEKRAQRRLRRDVERTLQRAYRSVCDMSMEEVQAMFSRPLDDGAFQSLQGYPEFLDLRDRRMEAVSTGLHLLPARISAVRDVVTRGYDLIGKNTYAARDNPRNRLIFHTYEQFNGVCVGISTNDVEVCRRVIALDLEPLEPWVAFPELAETAFGMLMGNIEYWWNEYWDPFWESLSPEGREAYLSRANKPWRSRIEADESMRELYRKRENGDKSKI